MDTLTNKENPLLLKEIEEYLKKGVKQREIAKLTKVSLVTVNKYCKRIKNNFKKEEREHRAKKREVLQRIELVKELRENAKEEVTEQELERNVKSLFNCLILEMRARIPTMSNSELQNITLEIWEKIR